jgi:hypothetical protein
MMATAWGHGGNKHKGMRQEVSKNEQPGQEVRDKWCMARRTTHDKEDKTGKSMVRSGQDSFWCACVVLFITTG